MNQPLSYMHPKHATVIKPIEKLIDELDSLSALLTRRALDLLTQNGNHHLHGQKAWIQVDVDVLYPYPIEISETHTGFPICIRVAGFNVVEATIGVGLYHLMVKAKIEQNIYLNEPNFGPKNPHSKEILRLLRIPVTVDEKNISASIKNGILVIYLPKMPTAKLHLAATA